jgi:hypothetical protein
MHSVSKDRSFVALRLIGEESLLLCDQIKIKQIRIAEKDSKPCSTDTRSEEHHHHSPTRSLHLDQMQGCILHSELPQIDCCFPIQFQLESENSRVRHEAAFGTRRADSDTNVRDETYTKV